MKKGTLTESEAQDLIERAADRGNRELWRVLGGTSSEDIYEVALVQTLLAHPDLGILGWMEDGEWTADWRECWRAQLSEDLEGFKCAVAFICAGMPGADLCYGGYDSYAAGKAAEKWVKAYFEKPCPPREFLVSTGALIAAALSLGWTTEGRFHIRKHKGVEARQRTSDLLRPPDTWGVVGSPAEKT